MVPLMIATSSRIAKSGAQKKRLTTHDRKQAPKGHGAELDMKTAAAMTVCMLALASHLNRQVDRVGKDSGAGPSLPRHK